jgi:hypothetical protein
MGAKKKRTTKKTTKRGRPRKTKTGAALMPAWLLKKIIIIIIFYIIIIMNTLSNIDIINIISKYNLSYCFGGVFSKDKLPLLKPNTFYIINLEDHDKGPGTHWTAFYYNTIKINIF